LITAGKVILRQTLQMGSDYLKHTIKISNLPISSFSLMLHNQKQATEKQC